MSALVHESNDVNYTNRVREEHPPLKRKRRFSSTLGEEIETYLEERERMVSNHEISERTLRTDRNALTMFRDWIQEKYGSLEVAEVEPLDIRDFKIYRRRSVSDTTVAKQLRHLKAFFSELDRLEIINSNPVTKVRIPKSRQCDTMPDKEEFDALKRWLDQRIRSSADPEWIHLLMKIATSTGMRMGALIQIKWEKGSHDNGSGHSRNYVYLQPSDKSLKIKFKGKEREIPVDHIWEVFKILDQQRDPNDIYVFSSPNEGYYDQSYVCRCWKREVKKVDELSEAYTCHDIRRAVISSLVKDDYTAAKIGQYVGHSTSYITDRYMQTTAEDLRDMTDHLDGMTNEPSE
jgi:site-specific recombinase XerD